MTVSMKNPQPTSHLTVKDRACPETANKARAPALPAGRAALQRFWRQRLAGTRAEVKPSPFTNDATLGKSQRPQQKAKQLHELAGHEINTNISYVAIHQQRTI